MPALRRIWSGHDSRRGITLPELMVVIGLMAAILAMVSVLFFRGRDAVEVSTQRLDTSGQARRAMDALTPFVLSAIAQTYLPLAVEDLTPENLDDNCALLVTTRENFLAEDYQPLASYVPNASVPPHRYRIDFNAARGELVANRLRQTTTGEEIDPDVSARLLGTNLNGCSFQLLSPGSVMVTLRTRADKDDIRRPDGVTTSILTAYLAAPGVR